MELLIKGLSFCSNFNLVIRGSSQIFLSPPSFLPTNAHNICSQSLSSLLCTLYAKRERERERERDRERTVSLSTQVGSGGTTYVSYRVDRWTIV
jgi:hypothetical protein